MQYNKIKEAITKKNGQTWEKVQASFTPSLSPSTWEHLTVIFLLHLWPLGTMKKILRATYFGVLYLMFQHQNLDYSKCQTYAPKNGIGFSGVVLPTSLFGLSLKLFCSLMLSLGSRKARFFTKKGAC